MYIYVHIAVSPTPNPNATNAKYIGYKTTKVLTLSTAAGYPVSPYPYVRFHSSLHLRNYAAQRKKKLTGKQTRQMVVRGV